MQVKTIGWRGSESGWREGVKVTIVGKLRYLLAPRQMYSGKDVVVSITTILDLAIVTGTHPQSAPRVLPQKGALTLGDII